MNGEAGENAGSKQQALREPNAALGISPPSHAPHQAFRPSLVALLLLAGTFFVNFLARIVLAPFLVAVESDLQLSHAEAGSLFLFISCGYCVSLLLSGFLSARLQHHRTIVVSAISLGLALFTVAYSGSLLTIRAGLVLIGLAAGLYLPSAMATITHLVVPTHWGKAVAIHELAPNLGFVVAPVLAEIMPASWSWREVLTLLGGGSLIMGTVFARFGAGGHFAGEPPNPQNLRRLVRLPNLWIMTVLFSLSISASIGLYTMIPMYLVVGRGWEPSWTNTVVSASRLGAMFTAVLGGWSVDRLGRKAAMGCFLVATSLGTMWLGLASDRWLIVAACLQPMLAVCFFPAGFATLSQIVPAHLRNISISLVILVGILIGAGLTPSLLGWLAEFQAFFLGFVALGALLLASTTLLVGLRSSSE